MAEFNRVDLNTGLDDSQVLRRMAEGKHNGSAGITTKSEGQIILENTLTFFNVINIVLAFLVLTVGSFKNALFMGVVISNALIGCVQEIRSKRIIDRLSLISSPKATVLRDSQRKQIQISDIVLDDLLCLSTGSQISVDAVVVQGKIEVNESLLTGESDPVVKRAGDKLLSGSFVVSGSCKAVVTAVGNDSYAAKIVKGAKYIKKPNSEIMKSLNFIVRIAAFAIVPVGIILFCKEYFLMGTAYGEAVISTVAALIGMIPEGLVLLTSVVFAVGVMRLSKHRTLVQELYCIETLARVDILCLDKTGTITEGSMVLEGLEAVTSAEDMEAALSALAANLKDDNPTFNAIKDKYKGQSRLAARYCVPFSSSRKWSGASFTGVGSYILGAYEFVFSERDTRDEALLRELSEKGMRVLALAHSYEEMNENKLPDKPKLLGFVLFRDKIRENAPETIRYFKEQGVGLKVISGDNAASVAAIAKEAGIDGAENYLDMSRVPEDADYEELAEAHSVFGRVTPEQKLKLIKALKAGGHTVAMTGDGVNDVLALKESDCSIAMAAGSDAARTVANLVLMDSDFSAMPEVVKEGRRSINNLQRSAALFLTKTFFFGVISILFMFVPAEFPFEPIQMTLISTLTIGIPSFILALEPNRERVRGNFMLNVIQKAAPISLAMFVNIIILVVLQNMIMLSDRELSTLAVLLTAVAGFILVFRLCLPFNGVRCALFGGLVAAFALCFTFFKPLFELAPMNLHMLTVTVPVALLSVVTVFVFTKLVNSFFKKKKPTLNIKDRERILHRAINRKNQ